MEFLRRFPDRIYHVHIKDMALTLNGRSGVLNSFVRLQAKHASDAVAQTQVRLPAGPTFLRGVDIAIVPTGTR